MKDFESVPHTADLKIRVYGTTLKDLFVHALIGMFQSIKPINTDCSYVNDRIVCPNLPIKRDVEINSVDRNALLVDFLSDAIYLSDVHNEAYLNVIIHELTDTQLKATLQGIEVQGFEVVEIKAVTYHDLDIHQVDNHWQTDIVFDI